MDIKNSVLSSILLVVFQLALFIGLHDGSVYLAKLIAEVKKPGIDWGIVINMAAAVFAIFASVMALLLKFMTQKYHLAVFLVGASIFAAVHFQQLTYRPYRTILVIGCGLISFFGPYLFFRKMAMPV